MYLKRIELHGFKSFADKSVVEFMPGITGIVGPNGCGKSNITDAIRWVLGEKSAKAMRGETMTDVIFSGSEDRKAQGEAEVTLVFNNEDHFLDFDSTEVEITRRLYRTGDSEFLLNREQCRLKDITDLIMDTGLGRDSLSIISQNNINEFVKSKPEDRRAMFEEAAGVAKYKKRKIETVRKLERTTDNLDRVQDICSELERQIGPLKRQKEKAETYLEFKEELQEVEVSVLVKEISTLSEELKTLNKELEDLENERITNDGAVILDEKQSEELEKKMYALDQEVNELQEKLLEAMNEVSSLETQKVEIDANRKHILETTSQEDIEAKKASMKSILQDAIIEYNDRVKRYNDVKKEKNDLSQKDALNKKQQSNLRSLIEKKNIDIHNSRTEKTRLTDIIENKSGYSYGVRTILGAKNSLSGICGALGDLIETEETYETALATALGGAIQFIVTRTNDQAKEAIYFLRKNKAGRATFLPIDTMKPRLLRDEAKMLAEQSLGYLGVMSDFVTYDKSISDVVLNQLGNTIVADHLDHATEIAKSIYHRYRVVTLEGDIINVGGSLTGGAVKHTNNAMMSKRELERVSRTLDQQEKDLNKMKSDLHTLENDGREIGQLYMQKQMSLAKLELVVTNKKNEYEVAKADYENLTHQSVELDEVIKGTQNNELLDRLNDAKRRRDELKETIQAKRTIRMGYVNENDEVSRRLREHRAALKDVESQSTDKKVTKSRLETEIQNYLLRLNDAYAMTFEHAQEKADMSIDIDKAKDKVRDLRQRIASLGHVNVESIEQYNDVSTRYETLSTQRSQLLEAQDSLLKAIKDMDAIMVEKFSASFEAINKAFNDVFRYLFGGGHASLKYTDPDNILETGIDIEAQPPGKAAKLHSFSGGENALIALSCLFAMISVKPSPLCILDEVEAALDIANVERFAKYLRSFSDQTQFIVVTHREGTMAECDLLYGATMQEKGVTKLVSVKLKDATEYASS